MTKEILFKKYNIDESHNVWDNQIDNWISVEVYRLMHDGKLPPGDDLSTKWIVDFLDKLKDMDYLVKLRNERNDFGSLYLTSKRMVYSHADAILKELNTNKLLDMKLAEAYEEMERLFRLRIKNQERAFKKFNDRRRENDIIKGHLKL